MARTEREKMLADEPYLASDPELVASRARARVLGARYNATAPDQLEERAAILREWLGRAGQGVWIEPPFFSDYGVNLYLDDGVYLNTNCVILDCNAVHIGRGTKLGPSVQIYTGYHPTDPAVRLTGVEMARPIRIGENAWIGGGAILCPGVEVGAEAIVGAGSVVTRNIPAGMVAVGNPCRVIRPV